MYNGEESFLGMCRYILEYIVWLNKVLIDLEWAKCIILGIKSHFCKNEIIIVGYHCNGKGWYLKELKIIKIIYWKDCENIISA